MGVVENEFPPAQLDGQDGVISTPFPFQPDQAESLCMKAQNTQR